MQIQKYTASGNDFLIFHALKKEDRSALARKLCDRHYGLGADGLIVIVPHESLDFEWEFYNSDGSYAAMCGNGSRAVGMYAFDNGLCGNYIRFLSGAGVIGVTIDGRDAISKLGAPKILKEPFFDHGMRWHLVDTGVPHLVTHVEDIASFDLKLAKFMRDRYNANVNFVQIVDGAILVRTFERGVEDETLACGTGMAASHLALHLDSKVPASSMVIPKSKEHIKVEYVNGELYFAGAVKRIFEASFSLEQL